MICQSCSIYRDATNHQDTLSLAFNPGRNVMEDSLEETDFGRAAQLVKNLNFDGPLYLGQQG